MKPARKDQVAPCKRKFGCCKKSLLCNRCVYYIKIHRKGIDFWRCVY